MSRKLDTLVWLSAIGLVRDLKTQKEQIALLSDSGFKPKQIADTLGTTSNTVSVTLTEIRRERTARESRQESASQAGPSDESAKEHE
jgi:DNA-binding NarL/FixJ family response regulator